MRAYLDDYCCPINLSFSILAIATAKLVQNYYTIRMSIVKYQRNSLVSGYLPQSVLAHFRPLSSPCNSSRQLATISRAAVA